MSSLAARNITIAFDLIQGAVADEDSAEGLGELDGTIVFENTGDLELDRHNAAVASKLVARGEPVVTLDVEKLVEGYLR